jgi:hypothetical protein
MMTRFFTIITKWYEVAYGIVKRSFLTAEEHDDHHFRKP